jgi:uncharacterized membrane protein HdeD (DUF308 family)
MATAADKTPQHTDAASHTPGRAINELWWLALVEGVVAVFFGIVAIFWPGLTLVALVYLFSAFILAWGIVEIVHGFLSIHRRDTWWLTLIFGVASLGVGIYLVRHPRVTFAAFIVIVGLTLIARGIFDVVGAFIDKRGVSHRGLTIIVGVAAVIAGIILLFQPAAGGVAFVWVLGLYALIYGALTIALAIEAKELVSAEHYPTNDRRKA